MPILSLRHFCPALVSVDYTFLLASCSQNGNNSREIDKTKISSSVKKKEVKNLGLMEAFNSEEGRILFKIEDDKITRDSVISKVYILKDNNIIIYGIGNTSDNELTLDSIKGLNNKELLELVADYHHAYYEQDVETAKKYLSAENIEHTKRSFSSIQVSAFEKITSMDYETYKNQQVFPILARLNLDDLGNDVISESIGRKDKQDNLLTEFEITSILNQRYNQENYVVFPIEEQGNTDYLLMKSDGQNYSFDKEGTKNVLDPQ